MSNFRNRMQIRKTQEARASIGERIAADLGVSIETDNSIGTTLKRRGDRDLDIDNLQSQIDTVKRQQLGLSVRNKQLTQTVSRQSAAIDELQYGMNAIDDNCRRIQQLEQARAELQSQIDAIDAQICELSVDVGTVAAAHKA